MSSRQFILRIFSLVTHRYSYHGLLWLSLFVLFTGSGWRTTDWLFSLSNSLIHLAFLAIGVYFNIRYLVPRYLSEKRYISYVLFLLLTVFIITPPKLFVLFLKAKAYPQYQEELLNNQHLQFALSLLIVVFSTVLKIASDWSRQQRVQKELEREKLQSELKFLRSQVNPHFLFNTLNSLYALTLKKSDKAPDMVLQLSDMMRYMLYECNEPLVPLEKEVDYIRNYLDLERIRYSQQAEISLEVNGLLNGQWIAPLMFVPFLENSFKHGISNSIGDAYVRVKMNILEEKVDFWIENSKPPTPSAADKPGGIGLHNLRRRLEILYPEQYILSIAEKPERFSVNLKIKLHHEPHPRHLSGR